MCMFDDADPNDWYSEEWRKARKPHKCCECGREIAVGEKYLRASCGGNGSVNTYKQCAHCTEAGKLLLRKCSGYVFGLIGKDLAEHVDAIYPWSGQAARLVVGIRRRWKNFAGSALLPVPVVRVRDHVGAAQ
jgi:hypothetical protein